MILFACALALTAPSPLTSVSISTSGTVAAGFSRDHKLRIWTLPDQRLMSTIDVSGRRLGFVALSNAGEQFVASDFNNDLTLWDTRSGQIVLQEHLEHYPLSGAFSHDDRFLALGFGSFVRLIDLSSKQSRSLGQSQAGVVDLAFSPDGSRLATAEGNAMVRVYDVRSGAVISENRDFSMEPLAIDFSADGKQVIAGGADSSLVFIDAATGKTLRRSPRMPNPIFDLKVSTDGREIAIVTLDANDLGAPSPVLVLDLTSLEEKARASTKEMIGGRWTVDGHLIGVKRDGDSVQLVRLR